MLRWPKGLLSGCSRKRSLCPLPLASVFQLWLDRLTQAVILVSVVCPTFSLHTESASKAGHTRKRLLSWCNIYRYTSYRWNGPVEEGRLTWMLSPQCHRCAVSGMLPEANVLNSARHHVESWSCATDTWSLLALCYASDFFCKQGVVQASAACGNKAVIFSIILVLYYKARQMGSFVRLN